MRTTVIATESGVRPSQARAATANTPAIGPEFLKEYRELIFSAAWNVRRTTRTPLAVEDLFGYGCIGLLDAARRFRTGRGTAFRSFAYHRIRGEMLDSLRRQGWQSRANYAKQRTEERQAQGENGPGGQEGDAAAKPAPSENEVDGITDLLGQTATPVAPLSLDLADDIADESSRSIDQLIDLRSGLARLPARERTILEMYYVADKNLDEIGRELGMTKSWVCKLHARAIKMLKDMMCDEGNGSVSP